MAFTPEKKNPGDLIKSQDWNEAMSEIVRLEGKQADKSGKVNRKGSEIMSGPLSIEGNVGIGTTNPSHKLHVLAADAVGLFESTGTQAFLRLSTNEGINNRVEITNRQGGRLSLWTAGGGDALNITKDGKVGIGTINPQAPLHVASYMAVGPFAPTTGQGGIDVTGTVAEFGFVKRTLTSWPNPVQAGDRFAWYNPDGTARLFTDQKGDLLIISGKGDLKIAQPDSFLDFGTDVRQMINLWGGGPDAVYGIGVQAHTQYYRSDGNFAWYIKGKHDDNELNAGTGGTLAMVIRGPGGNVGIGTTNPRSKLEVLGGGIRSGFGIPTGSNAAVSGYSFEWDGDTGMFAEKDGALDLWSNCVRTVSIRSGNVGIGTTDPAYTLQVNGSAAKPNGGYWTNSSDVRLKKNIKTLKGALDSLVELRGVTFEWKEPEKHGNLTGKQMGLIAQEVEIVIPEWVGTDPDGHKNINIAGFEALIVEAFKELIEKLTKLEKKNEAMENTIKTLEKKLK